MYSYLRAFLYLSPYIIIPTLAMKVTNNVLIALISTLITSLFLNLIVTKQSNYENERRCFAKDAHKAITIESMQEFQISLDNYLFFLEDAGYFKTQEKIQNLEGFGNISTFEDASALVKKIIPLRPCCVEQAIGLLKL